MLKLFNKRERVWLIICVIIALVSMLGTRYYMIRQNAKVYKAMANYMDRTEYALIQLYDLAKEYEEVIKRCKCTQN